MVVTINSETLIFEPDPDDESSRSLQVPGPQGYREIVDITDERSRSPKAVNHETAVEVMKAAVDVKKALSFSVVL